MDKSEIKSKEEENTLGNWILLPNLIGILIFMVFELFKSFNNETIGEWYFYFSVIGYSWGIIFVSIFLFFTVRNLIK